MKGECKLQSCRIKWKVKSGTEDEGCDGKFVGRLGGIVSKANQR